jgi:uncharacterized spore protein YtfJ
MGSTADDKGSETAIHEAESASGALAYVVGRLAKMVGPQAHAETIFGTPITRERVTVIPVARAIGGFGAGSGSGGGVKGSEQRVGAGLGIGGGGGFLVSPVGIIEITADGARFQPFEQSFSLYRDLRALVRYAFGHLGSRLRRRS